MNIRKGDTVAVTVGKDKGKQGKVAQIFPTEGRIVVEGANMIKRHSKGRPGVRQGGIIQREASLDISNVALVCSKCGKPTRVGHKILDDGKKVRTCLKCKETVD